jgi:hypothetical protein
MLSSSYQEITIGLESDSRREKKRIKQKIKSRMTTKTYSLREEQGTGPLNRRWRREDSGQTETTTTDPQHETRTQFSKEQDQLAFKHFAQFQTGQQQENGRINVGVQLGGGLDPSTHFHAHHRDLELEVSHVSHHDSQLSQRIVEELGLARRTHSPSLQLHVLAFVDDCQSH